MVVKIEQISEDGLVLDEPISAALLTSALESGGRALDFRAQRGSQLHAELNKVSGSVLLRGRFAADMMTSCKRCLADVSVPVSADFTLNLVPKSLIRGDSVSEKEDDGGPARVGSFDLSDADAELFNGRTIDLDPILREQVLLALPMNVVCREDCKGLCPSCGRDLNEGPCQCESQTGDPRLAVLRNIKLN
jgi:uncharacterized protein